MGSFSIFMYNLDKNRMCKFYIILISQILLVTIISAQINKKIIGKWRGVKITGYLSEDVKSETMPLNDTLIFYDNNSYTWKGEYKQEIGTWKIEKVKPEINSKIEVAFLNFEDMNGSSNGGIYIYKLSNKRLIFRLYGMVGNKSNVENSMDMYFNKYK
jgi:hypothetical protein